MLGFLVRAPRGNGKAWALQAGPGGKVLGAGCWVLECRALAGERSHRLLCEKAGLQEFA